MQGRYLCDKEFRYLRTVRVTAAVYWGFDFKLIALVLFTFQHRAENGFPIGDPWITEFFSPWCFAFVSVHNFQCQGIHPMHITI
eukprot:SM000262S09892  [mRNA]  locus=s262:84483:86518:- [translate_table: standard]